MNITKKKKSEKNLSDQQKCYGCGTSENLELTNYIDIKKNTWYDSKGMANVTEKTTTKTKRLLCMDCINKAKKFGKKVILIGIMIIFLGIAVDIYIELLHAPGLFGGIFGPQDYTIDFLDVIPFIIIGVGIYIIYYGNRIKTQPSRHYKYYVFNKP